MNSKDYTSIPKEKFEFVNKGERLTDVKLQTKPTTYFQDAMGRFVKNKASVFCFVIILLLIIYAIFAPLFSRFKIGDKDGYYQNVTPRSRIFSKLGFWDGGRKMEVNQATYEYYLNGDSLILKDYGTVEHLVAKRPVKYHKIKIDTYAKVGYVKKLLTQDEYEKAKAWEKETGKKLFYPVRNSDLTKQIYKNDENAWFLTDEKGNIQRDKMGNIIDIYLKDETSPDGFAYSISRMNGNQIETRVNYREWYYYQNGFYANFIFGTDSYGYDIWTRMAYGARLSIILSFAVSIINLALGVVIGAWEGYYGGAVDLVIERIKDILSYVPTMIIFGLFQLYFAKSAGPIVSLAFAFIFYGWAGTSSTVRAQFYRYKNQDYINASRTLGAKDSRLIFKHILPNAIGYIITASVLVIPGVIKSESMLTYLGIVNLEGSSATSVGTMMSTAQGTFTTYPHALFFPAAFVAILLICFNSFGNGLRDAFNPQLRGAENA